ncbi:class I SAM-dependent methyltransferase [Nocardia sp. BMG51109]|uniref:class I SAM-dependent methyltransferase n=1 Tax=Nocardia sp. BMG51109 TaxID=1056816 RepID=UPI0012EBBA62|nr:class I SAM-dependent methyltransferase [Nocardia sp. BMG51109]
MRGVAAQLGQPSGALGPLVGRLLNYGNRGPVTGSVEALAAAEGHTVADIGFGGGLSLGMLLDRVGARGTVYGVDISTTAVKGARRRFRRAVEQERLRLFHGPMDRMPLPDDTFDCGMTVNTVYYLSDDGLLASLEELNRVMRAGARVVVGLGDPKYTATLPFAVGLRLRPVDEVAAVAEASGLSVVDHSRVGKSERAFHVLAALAQ